MSYCAGHAGIEADSVATAEKMLESLQDRATTATEPPDNGGQNGDAVTSKAGLDKEKKRKPEGEKAQQEEDEAGGKRRRFNAGVTEDEMGKFRFCSAETQQLIALMQRNTDGLEQQGQRILCSITRMMILIDDCV